MLEVRETSLTSRKDRTMSQQELEGIQVDWLVRTFNPFDQSWMLANGIDPR